MANDNRIRLGTVLLSYTPLIALFGAVIDAVTLRSCDGVDYIVNTTSAIAHSEVLRNLCDDLNLHQCDDAVCVPLPAITSTELQLIAEFINRFAVHEVYSSSLPCTDVREISDIPLQQNYSAAEFVRNKLEAMGIETQCQMVITAHYLQVELLLGAVASTKRRWSDFAAMRLDLPSDALWFIVDNAPGMVRLREAAGTDDQRGALYRQIRDLLVTGQSALISDALWGCLDTLLLWAARHGEESVVEFLLSGPVDVNARSAELETALHLATTNDHVAVVALLLKAPGINVNARGFMRRTPLHSAAIWRRSSILDLLLAAPGIDVNARDQASQTPLHLVACSRRVQLVRRLVDFPGIDLYAEDDRGRTALACARKLRDPDAVSLLVSHMRTANITSPRSGPHPVASGMLMTALIGWLKKRLSKSVGSNQCSPFSPASCMS